MPIRLVLGATSPRQLSKIVGSEVVDFERVLHEQELIEEKLLEKDVMKAAREIEDVKVSVHGGTFLVGCDSDSVEQQPGSGTTKPPNEAAGQVCFLTGATGFLGGHLLDARPFCASCQPPGKWPALSGTCANAKILGLRARIQERCFAELTRNVCCAGAMLSEWVSTLGHSAAKVGCLWSAGTCPMLGWGCDPMTN